MEPVTLRTPRLTLSPPTDGDADAITAACQDPEIRRYTMVPWPYTRADAESFVVRAAARWERGAEVTWAIREGDLLAGMMGVHDIDHGNGSLGYWMAPASRGRGLAAEAAAAVADWALAEDGLGLVRLEWRAVVGNTGSARLARRLGFHYEGTLRQEFVNPRARHDGWIASLLRTDDRSPQPWPPLEDARADA